MYSDPTLTPIELLAPAKDRACGEAAIDCGADAVYIGASQFGARENAANEMEDIAALAAYAHRYWARVYVVLNTILRDDELPLAVDTAWKAAEAGADALIIQDVGLLESKLPPLPLFSSTQMHNITPERVAFWEASGFTRAILARELDLDEIRAIHAAAPRIELECFVHGALCVCHSGQCYLSYALGGRSGNRGECAQPCRKGYTVLDANGVALGQEKHWLSLRDLDRSAHLHELIEAGVSSFKIEGRLKDRAYVANITAYYRQKLDEILGPMGRRKSSSGRISLDFTPDPGKTFNRGYSAYFLEGHKESVGAPDTPKMLGALVGQVKELRGRRVVLDRDGGLNAGDGLTWFAPDGRLSGSNVNGAEGREISLERTDGLVRGTQIRRNRDHRFLQQLAASRTHRAIEVSMTLTAVEGGLRLEVLDEDGVRAGYHFECTPESAQQPDVATQSLRERLCKTGGTAFVCTGADIQVDPPPFLPASAVNALRRGVLTQLEAAREEARPKGNRLPENPTAPLPEGPLDYTANVLNRAAAAFYQRHGATEVGPAAETGLDLRGARVMTMRYCLRYEMGRCPKHHPGSDRTASPLFLADAEGNRLELRFRCNRCEMEVYLNEKAPPKR